MKELKKLSLGEGMLYEISKGKKLENKIAKYDSEIQAIFEAMRQLMTPPEKPKSRFGFCED